MTQLILRTWARKRLAELTAQTGSARNARRLLKKEAGKLRAKLAHLQPHQREIKAFSDLAKANPSPRLGESTTEEMDQ